MRTPAIVLVALVSLGARPAWAAPGECEIKLEGAFPGAAKQAATGSAFATDYWMSDAELRSAIALVTPGKDSPEKQKQIDEAMARDPRVTIFLLSCQTDVAKVSILSSSASKYKDVPMKAGKYKIVSTAQSAPAGTMTVLPRVKAEKGLWRPAGDGELDIAEWNRKHVAGRFTVPVEHDGKNVTIKGSFDFPCNGSTTCQK